MCRVNKASNLIISQRPVLKFSSIPEPQDKFTFGSPCKVLFGEETKPPEVILPQQEGKRIAMCGWATKAGVTLQPRSANQPPKEKNAEKEERSRGCTLRDHQLGGGFS